MIKRYVVACLVAVSVTTFADAQFSSSQRVPMLDSAVDGTPRDATGDTYTAANAVFSATNAGLIHDVSMTSHTFPGTESMGDSALYATSSPGSITASSTSSGLTETFTFTWEQADASALIPAGANLGGEIITGLSFEMGSANTAGSGTADTLDWTPAMPFTVTNPDSDGDGVHEADFTLLDAAGGTIFTGSWFVTPTSNGFSGVTFLNAGGADLSTFNIGGAVATVTIEKVPEPASAIMALLGLLSIGWLRRR